MEQKYIDAHNWYVENQQNLGMYRGEWIAFTSNGVIAHDSPKETLREREYLKTLDPQNCLRESPLNPKMLF
jgi:hypothetical protein